MTGKHEKSPGIAQRARRILEDIRAGEPGKRFRRYWRLRKDREQGKIWRKTAVVFLGFLLLTVGILLGPVPLAQGFVFAVPGLAILASRFRIVALILDKGELAARRLIGMLRVGKE